MYKKKLANKCLVCRFPLPILFGRISGGHGKGRRKRHFDRNRGRGRARACGCTGLNFDTGAKW